MKKKIIFILAVAVMLALIAGCSEKVPEPSAATKVELDFGLDEYPLYQSFDEEEKSTYALLCDAMVQHDSSDLLIGVYDSREEMKAEREWIEKNYRQIVYEQPDFFWVNPYYFTVKEMETAGKHRLYLSLSYVADKEEAESMKTVYNTEVERIVSEAKKQLTLFDKVLYVHDEILANTEYDEELMKQEGGSLGVTAYGCLVEGKTVCSGYTLAFTSIMQKLGIECGAEFNTYDNFTLIDGHVWNYCKLGDEYYYFDLTWDDTGFDSEEYKPYMDFGHTYFAVNKEELSKSNFTMQDDAPTPDCNGTEYNYFVYTEANVSVYDAETVRSMITAQKDNKFIALRFDSYGELLRAQGDFLDNGEIYNLLEGVQSISYSISKSSLHLYIFPK